MVGLVLTTIVFVMCRLSVCTVCNFFGQLELGEFFDAQSSTSVSSPTRMRVGLTSAMMRVDTPSSPQRPVSRAVTAAKQADR
eukprot:COSAG02_NODE_14579_length_1257_cov_143.291298_2_plen_82_part_00